MIELSTLLLLWVVRVAAVRVVKKHSATLFNTPRVQRMKEGTYDGRDRKWARVPAQTEVGRNVVWREDGKMMIV